jgi:hypothetical protein
MTTAILLGRPALEPLSIYLETRFGKETLTHDHPRMVGHMIRQILRRHDFLLAGSKKITTPGNLFKSGATYAPVSSSAWF